MKKIILSSILLLSCAVRAENAPDNISPENVTFENSVSQDIIQENISAAQNISPDIAAQDVAQEKFSKTLKSNIEIISENCDSIVLTFKINKNKNCENNQAWQETIYAISDLIDFAENANNSSEEDIAKVLNKSYEFLQNCSKSTGCTGNYSINLNLPEDFAKTIFQK